MKLADNSNFSTRGVNEGSISSVNTDISKSSQGSNHILSIGPGYKILKKIGSGNFGEIWLAKSLSFKGENVAIKLEKSRRRISQLQSEYRIYQNLGKNKYMPSAYYFCQTPKYNAIVMDVLGPTLEDVFNWNHNKFSLKTNLLISIQIVRIFEFIHSNGIIYRDVKPQNFLLSSHPEEDQRIYIIDFGLAKEYINPLTRNHIPYTENKSLTGTARYMSINTHLGREQSRRDDLESVGHMLIYFLRGALPWQGLNDNQGNQYIRIRQVKQATTIENLCKDIPDIWATFLSYCRNLEFYQRPDYKYLINIFKNFYLSLNYPDDLFDWHLIKDSGSSESKASNIKTVSTSVPRNSHPPHICTDVSFLAPNNQNTSDLLNPELIKNSSNSSKAYIGHIPVEAKKSSNFR
ncbi:hypothetical protein MXB_2836 [Myxobolus squamalis]|nr:hypothetical protein MXB_2836 [Myxobolus squamalis]